MNIKTQIKPLNSISSLKFKESDLLILFGLLFLVVFLYFINVDRLALLDPDEPRYAASAREMLETGNWIVPYFNGQPRLNKPPLSYWLTALSFKLFGVSEFSARFPSLIFAIGGIVLTFFWARTMWGRLKAFWAGFILAVTPLYLGISHLCITDMTMTFFLYLSLYVFYTGYERGMHSDRQKLCIYISLAMVFLTKGHVGILIFSLIICSFLLISRDIKYLARLWSFKGTIVFAALTLPWSVMFLAKVGINNVFNLVSHETYDRFIGGYQHPEPFYFYVKFFFLDFFPWSFFIPLLLWLTLLRKIFKNRDSRIEFSELQEAKDKIKTRFFCVWFVVVLVFFSTSSSKLFTYILPMAPTVPFLFISLFNSVELKRKRSDFAAILTILTILFIFSLITVITFTKWIPDKYVMHSDKFALISYTFLACIVLTIALFITKGVKLGQYGLGFTNYLVLTIIVINLHILIGDNRSTRDMAENYLPRERDSYTLFAYRNIPPSLVFYTGKIIKKIEREDITSLQTWEVENNDIYLYMREKDFESCKKELYEIGFCQAGKGSNSVFLKKT